MPYVTKHRDLSICVAAILIAAVGCMLAAAADPGGWAAWRVGLFVLGSAIVVVPVVYAVGRWI